MTTNKKAKVTFIFVDGVDFLGAKLQLSRLELTGAIADDAQQDDAQPVVLNYTLLMWTFRQSNRMKGQGWVLCWGFWEYELGEHSSNYPVGLHAEIPTI